MGDRALCQARAGNGKGTAEGLVGYVQRNVMTPVPVAESFGALKARFPDACTERRQARLRGHAVAAGAL